MNVDPHDPLGVDPLLEASARWDAELAETRRRWDQQYPVARHEQAPAAQLPRPVRPPQWTPPTDPQPLVPPLAGWCEDRRPGVNLTDHDGRE